MRRCIVHYGMPKTGSTSIQVSLQAAGPLPECHYLSVGDSNSGRVLATMFLDNPREFHLNRKWKLSPAELAEGRRQAFAEFERQFRSDHTLYVISGEAISSMDEPTLRRMRDWLLTQVDEVRAVGYVRKPKGYMESELQQKVKAGRGRFDLASHYPGYRARFEPLENVFGADQVEYWLFDPASFPDKDVVRDFARRLGLSVPDSAIHRSNEALTRSGVSLLYLQRKFGEGFGRGTGQVEQNRRLHRALREVPGPKLRLAASAVHPILAAQADDIAWMAQRLGASLAESLGEDGPDDIRDENDLLHPGPEALQWLAERLGRPLPAEGLPHETIATWVTELRSQLVPARGGQDQRRLVQVASPSLTAAELARRCAAAGLAGEWTAADLERVVKTALKTLAAALAAEAGGATRVEGLGRFAPRHAGRSQTDTAAPTSLLFVPAADEDAA